MLYLTFSFGSIEPLARRGRDAVLTGIRFGDDFQIDYWMVSLGGSLCTFQVISLEPCLAGFRGTMNCLTLHQRTTPALQKKADQVNLRHFFSSLSIFISSLPSAMTPYMWIPLSIVLLPRPFLQLLKIPTRVCRPHIYLPMPRLLRPKEKVRPGVSCALNPLTQAVNAMG
jgi:hypothetical protein